MRIYVESNTWASGETPTSSILSVDLRDSPLFLRSRNYFDSAVSSQQLLNSGSAITANRVNYIRVSGAGIISKLRYRVTAQVDGKLQLGVYGSTGSGRTAVPGTRRAVTEVTEVPGVGDIEVALGAEIEVTNEDWFAITCTVAASFGHCGSTGGFRGETFFTGLLHYQDSVFPLPATAAATGAGGDGLFAIAGVVT